MGVDRRPEIDTIISDIGDVVIMFDQGRSADIERRYGVAEGCLLDAVLKSPAARMAAVGQLDHAEWLRRVTENVPRIAVQEWLAYHGELNLPVVEMLVTARRNGLRVLLLSNATVRLWDDLDYHGIRDLADRVFCSADIGFAKPDPRVYGFVADATSLAMGRTFYVDDTSSWVEVGRKLGMRGYVYGTPDELRRQLADLGVTV
ncbi:MAG: HAD family hydrolase [Pseudonocardiaceae bacterium]